MSTKSDTGIIIGIVIVSLLVIGGIYYGFQSSDNKPSSNGTSVDQTKDIDITSQKSVTTLPTNKPTQTMSALEKGQAFLAENKNKPGIITTPSGLQYEIIKAGTGPHPTKDQIVKVNYEGTLIDGTIFDSSYKRGEPIEFGVTQVIPGWVEALQLMQVGAKWKLFIPSELAYGSSGAGGAIGPNETLIFTVELLAIQNK